MPEPTSTTGTSIVALAMVLMGPIAGPYAAIAFAAFAGSLWAVSRPPARTTGAGLLLMVKLLLTALVLTGSLALYLEHEYNWSAAHIMPGLAFAIGAFGDKWTVFLDGVWKRAVVRVGVDLDEKEKS